MVRRWASTRGSAASASGIVSRAIDHLFKQGAGLPGRPPAVASRVLLVRRHLRNSAASIRQIEDRVVAEAVLAARRLGHRPFTLALCEPHPTGGLDEGDDAAEAAGTPPPGGPPPPPAARGPPATDPSHSPSVNHTRPAGSTRAMTQRKRQARFSGGTPSICRRTRATLSSSVPSGPASRGERDAGRPA